MTKRTVLSVLQSALMTRTNLCPNSKRGIDSVLRYTEGRAHLWGHLHRPPHGVRAERLTHGQGTFGECLAGTLLLPYAGQPPIPLSISVDAADKAHVQNRIRRCRRSGRYGLAHSRRSGDRCRGRGFHPGDEAQKKKKRKGGWVCNRSINN